MKKRILLFLIFLLLLISGCKNSSEIKENDNYKLNLSNLLSDIVNKDTVIVVDRVFENEYYEILDKRAISIDKNIDWYREYTKNKIYPYPYNEKFGITKEEYNNFLNGEYINLVEIKEIDFSCEEVSKVEYKIKIGQGLLEFNINTNENQISLPNGELLTFSKDITEDSQKQQLLGTWNGYTYTFVDSTLTREALSHYGINDNTDNIGYENIVPELIGEIKCELASISIGKFTGKNEYLIYYRYIDTSSFKTDYQLYYIK